jgi:hypothetical protein
MLADLTLVEIVLAGVIAFVVVGAIIIDHRNGGRNRSSKENVRDEIQNFIARYKNK